MLKGELNNMQSQINRGSSHQLSMIKIELSKTNKKLDGLIDLLVNLLDLEVKRHKNYSTIYKN